MKGLMDKTLSENTDYIFHDKRLGKGSKMFKHLELGTLPVEFVMKKKSLRLLKYILDENNKAMISVRRN